jgi:hypothetical protein
MGISYRTLHRDLVIAKNANLITFDDQLERIEFEVIPKTVDNLLYFLEAKDKTVTIETAKGTVFRQFQDSKGISDNQQTMLCLKIEQPDGSEVKVVTGHIVGKPKELSDPAILVENETDESPA